MLFNLAQTQSRLMHHELLTINEITAQKTLDEVADIFVRVNSGGTKLAKTDLLFSLVASNWKESRCEFQNLIKELDFDKFDNDFIMRCCLAICLNDPSIKADKLTPDRIALIKDKWSGIKNAITESTEKLRYWGFSSETISGTNAVIPIVYCIYTVHERNEKLSKAVTAELRKCFVTIMLTDRFSQGTDKEVPRLIKAIDKALDGGTGGFTFQKVSAAYAENTDSRNSLAITKETIEDLLTTPKNSPKTFILLSILEPSDNPIRLHIDHMHPKAGFNKIKPEKLGISQEKLNDWKEKREQLPNLQLLTDQENQSKNDTPFSDWVAGKREDDRKQYLAANGLTNFSLALQDFDAFFEARTKFLTDKLAEYFNVDL